jgi:quinol monooxygenase YgiN
MGIWTTVPWGKAVGANMSYGIIVRVQAPVEAYETAHKAVLEELAGRGAEGMLCHIGRAVDGGFEVIEVWESKEAADKFNDEVVIPAMVRTGVAMPGDPPELTEFQPLDVLLGGVGASAGARGRG